MHKISIIAASIFALFAIGILTVLGQDNERSQLIQYVESRISTPSYQIRLNGLEGTLSSNVSLESITIADANGIWLNIEKPKLVWTRSELLRGRLVVDQLQAQKVHLIRKPLEDTSLPAPESSGFAIPELPVSVVLKRLELPHVEFGKDVIDLAAKASVLGKLVLDDGSMNLDLKIARLDGGGGQLNALSNYNKVDKVLDLDIQLSEPKNGVLSSAIGLDGRPPVELSVTGKAPLTDLNVVLAFNVDSQRILTGDLQLNEKEDGMLVRLDLNGSISKLLSPTSKDFLGEQTVLHAQMHFPENGGFVLEHSSLSGGALGMKANAATTIDGFVSALNVDLDISDKTGAPVKLPFANGRTDISSARFSATYDAEKNEDWFGSLRIDQFNNSEISIEDITFNARGEIQNFLDPKNRHLRFDTSGWMDAITAKDTSLAEAIGSSIRLSANGDWQSGLPVKLHTLKVVGETMRLTAQGAIAEGVFGGTIEAQVENLEAFSAFAGNKISGSFNAKSDGSFDPLTGSFDLTLSGSGKSLAVGNPFIDPLFWGKTILSGRVARTSKGLAFNRFNLSNQQIDANIDGNLASASADLTATASISDIRIIDQKSRGRLNLDLSLEGNQSPFDLTAQISMPDGRLVGQLVEDLALRFDGTSNGAELVGELSSDGLLAQQAFDVSGNVEIEKGHVKLETLAARIGSTRIEGNFFQQVDGLIQSKLTLNSKDISALAALFLADASGKVSGNLELTPQINETQSVTFDISANELLFSDFNIASAHILGNGNDILAYPKINATVDVRDVLFSGVEATSINGQVKTNGNTTLFDLTSRLRQNQTRLSTSGEYVQSDIDTQIVLRELIVNSNITDARLASPSTIFIQDQSARLSGARLEIGGGIVDISGTAGQHLDIAAIASNVPLSVLNSITPELGANGTVDGSITAKGTSSKPMVAFNMDGRNVSLTDTKNAGLAPIQVSTSGSFSDDVIRLDQLSLRNAQALELNGSGALPIVGQGLNLSLSGGIPLKILEQVTIERGTKFVGQANVNVRLTGSLAEPKTSGDIRVRNGTISDPIANLRLKKTSIDIILANSQKADLQMRTSLSGGGSVKVNGALNLAPGMPANIDVELNSARYSDGQTFSTTVSGNLQIDGKLLEAPFLSGDVFLSKTEISVPETFSTNSNLLEVEHVSPSSKTAETLQRIKQSTPRSEDNTGSAPLRLDVTVNAPNQIFVRGRGLDAELGGSIRLLGSLSNLSPQGKFTLRRGRLSILSQRLDLVEGDISLEGDLDPVLNFLATTSSSDVQAFIRLSGPASSLQVSFSSNPELPEDEVLAHIIFGRNITDLSPAQIARLASLAAELTGGNRPTLIDGLRANTGLDDIDIVQYGDGNAAVKAGKYVSDNVYLGVQAGRDTEATINLDITDDLTARGAVNSRGESTLGIFFEKDY